MTASASRTASAALIEGSSTLYADPAQLEAWFGKAKPGARAIYAQGASIDPRHPVALLVQGWIDREEVIPLKERVAGVLHYLVQRRAAGSREGAGKMVRETEFDETPKGAIMRVVRRCTNLGLPFPALSELARLTGLRDAEAARYQFNLLKAEGRLEVRQVGTFNGRQVLDVETGKWTAEPGVTGEAAVGKALGA